jgi:hypothetical protein
MAFFQKNKPKFTLNFSITFEGSEEAANAHKQNVETLLSKATEDEMKTLALLVQKPILRSLAMNEAKKQLGI